MRWMRRIGCKQARQGRVACPLAWGLLMSSQASATRWPDHVQFMLTLSTVCLPPQLLCNTVLVMETAGAHSLTVPLIAATFVAKVGRAHAPVANT